MNESIKAIILGVIQGLTEFLPVSSSGHLEIAKKLLNVNMEADESLLLTVILHTATALSTVVVFRHDLFDLASGMLKGKWNEQTIFVAKIAVSMIPAAIVGVAFEDQIEAMFSGNLLLVGISLLVTGLLLFLAGRARETEKGVSWLDSVIIGISQAIAILPGVSRSGTTISTSVLLGIDREKAAQFSFLMVIPLILGKIAKTILDGDLGTNGPPALALGLGFVAAFASGVFACRWMISLVRKCQLWWFSVYCFTLGTIAIAVNLLD